MTVFRSALFACALVAAGSACRQRAEVNPEADRVIRPAAGTSITATPIPQTYEATVPPAAGTAAPYGQGALGGAAVATQPLAPEEQEIAAEPGPTPAAEPATAVDRQGRSITVRRRTTPGPKPAPTPSTTTPSTMPQDTTTRPAEDTLSTHPEPGISDTSTQSTRANPDSQEQGIGGGDTYDRNR